MKLTFAQVNDLVSSKFKSTDAEKCSLKFRDFQMTRDFPAYAKLIEVSVFSTIYDTELRP